MYPKQEERETNENNNNNYPLNPPWDWPDLQDIEVDRAIKSTNSKKAPGNDRVGNTILKKAYTINPSLFNSLYKACFQLGYHPKH